MIDLDISNCDTEPIRFPGAVQPHGALLVLRADDGFIEAASESCAVLLGMSAEKLLGQSIDGIFGPPVLADILSSADSGLQPLQHLTLNGREFGARPSINAAGQVLVDIEAAEQNTALLHATIYQCHRITNVLRSLVDITTLASEAVRLIRGVTGLDRVMVYRFDPEWNGEVIAESCADNISSFLDHHFPASDIPKQARELFQSGTVRMIPDALYDPSPLMSGDGERAIDLAWSSLRSVSPVHLQYLKNMGVRASLSGALVVEGRLWGLLASHHCNAPKYFGPEQRDVFGWLCEDISALIEATLIRLRWQQIQDLAIRRRKLINAVRSTSFKTLMRHDGSTELLDVIGANGFALLAHESIYTIGDTPSLSRIRDLQARRRACENDNGVFATNNLTRNLGMDDAGDGVAGALFVSLLNRPDFTMIWFRNERVYLERWAGDPEQAHCVDEYGHISPRKSFAQFLRQVGGQSLHWTGEELGSVAELGALIEIEFQHRNESERKFLQSIFARVREAICISEWNAERHSATVLLVSQAFARLNVHANRPTTDKHKAEPRDILIGPETTPAEMARMSTQLNEQEPVRTEVCRYGQDGTAFWIDAEVNPIQDDTGRVTRWISIERDITDRKLAETSLEHERTQLRTLLQTIPDMVWLKSPEGVYLTCNPAFEQFFGAHEVDIIGKTDYDFVAQTFAHALREDDQATVAAARPRFIAEWGTYASDGRRVLLEITKTPMRDARGTLLGVLGIAHDITERRKEELELERHRHHLETLVEERTIALSLANDAAEAVRHASVERLRTEAEARMQSRKLEAVGTLAAGIAHDFNNILGSIVGFAEMTADDLADDSRAKRNVAQILSACFRAHDLIARILAFAGQSPKEPVAVDVGREVRETLALLRGTLRPSVPLHLQSGMDEARAPITILADPTQIQQIVMNLCINAAQAMDYDGIVCIRIDPVDKISGAVSLVEGISLTVTDTGGGITPEVLERMFDPFFTTKAPSGGSGLGLSVVHGIVADLGGSIEVQSCVEGSNTGTEFRVFLPIEKNTL